MTARQGPHARSHVVTIAVPSVFMRSAIRGKLHNEPCCRPSSIDLFLEMANGRDADDGSKRTVFTVVPCVGILNIDKAGAGILVLICCFLLLLYLAPPPHPASHFLINLWPKLLVSFSFRVTSRELPSRSISFSRRILLPETFFLHNSPCL